MNSGENAYDTRCFIQLPSGVEYVSSNSSSIVRTTSENSSRHISIGYSLGKSLLSSNETIGSNHRLSIGKSIIGEYKCKYWSFHQRSIQLNFIDLLANSYGCEELFGYSIRSIGIHHQCNKVKYFRLISFWLSRFFQWQSGIHEINDRNCYTNLEFTRNTYYYVIA